MKCGLKTFPLSVDLDDSVKLVEAEFGVKGFAIVIKLYQAIYSRGYYMKWDIDAQLLFIRDYCLSEVGRSLVSEVVDCCIRRGVFEQKLFKEHKILTSKRIQETFLTATKRSTKVVMEEQYALPIVYEFIENVSKSGKNVNISFKNADIFQQRKEKERKVKETSPNPLQGGGRENWKEKFFEKFTLFERKNYKDDGVDYEILYREFEQSTTLQKMWSFPKIVKLYPQIAKGDFRDKPTEQQQRIDSINERGARESYYSNLRNKAQGIADYHLEKARQDTRFVAIEKELAKLEIALAKAELYKQDDLLELQEKKQKYLTERRLVLSLIGISESSLLPKWKCDKCQDTGWKQDGYACDCYPKK